MRIPWSTVSKAAEVSRRTNKDILPLSASLKRSSCRVTNAVSYRRRFMYIYLPYRLVNWFNVHFFFLVFHENLVLGVAR